MESISFSTKSGLLWSIRRASALGDEIGVLELAVWNHVDLNILLRVSNGSVRTVDPHLYISRYMSRTIWISHHISGTICQSGWVNWWVDC